MSKTTLESILGVFAKRHISFRMSVCPSAENNSTPTKRIFMKRHFGIFTNICRHILPLVEVEEVTDTLHVCYEVKYIFPGCGLRIRNKIFLVPKHS